MVLLRGYHIGTLVRLKFTGVWNPPTVWWTVLGWWRSRILGAIPSYLWKRLVDCSQAPLTSWHLSGKLACTALGSLLSGPSFVRKLSTRWAAQTRMRFSQWKIQNGWNLSPRSVPGNCRWGAAGGLSACQKLLEGGTRRGQTSRKSRAHLPRYLAFVHAPPPQMNLAWIPSSAVYSCVL